MRTRKILSLIVLCGFTLATPLNADCNRQAEGNCYFLADWFHRNTEMSIVEVHDWLILCLNTWGCYVQ
jgi:hypothetical protein